jgi:hypothetical protein
MSELRTNRIIPRDGLTSGTGVGGGIIQIKQTIKKDTFTTANNTSNYIDITGLSVAITPTRSDSKILVKAVIYNSNANAVNFFRLLRGSTFIEQPSGTSSSGAGYNAHAFAYYNADNWQDSTVIEILDSPATTSATTYKIQMAVTSNTGTINKFYNTSNYYGISTITAMEVSG